MFESIARSKGWSITQIDQNGTYFYHACTGETAWYPETKRSEACRRHVLTLLKGKLGAANELQYIKDAERWRALVKKGDLLPEHMLTRYADELLHRYEDSI